MLANRLVILDRDGVINKDSDDFVKDASEWIPIPGSLEAIAMLNKANVDVVVVTNQSGIGRGLFTQEALNEMHEKMQKLLAGLGGHISDIFYCPHLPDEGCACRKPKAGLLDQLEQKHQLSVKGAPLIGDSERDLVCGETKGCLPILVKTGKGLKYFEQDKQKFQDTLVFENLSDACHHLLKHHFINL